jgi:hypothetical protein
MAGRKKGTPKTGGRQGGTPNRTTKEARELLEQVLLGQVDNIKTSLESLKKESDAKYLDACSKLFTYVLPKKTDITSGDEKIPAILPNIIIRNGS